MKKIDLELNILLSRLNLFIIESVVIEKSYDSHDGKETNFRIGNIIFTMKNDDNDFSDVTVIFKTLKNKIDDGVLIEFKQVMTSEDIIGMSKKKKKKNKVEDIVTIDKVVISSIDTVGLFRALCYKIKNKDLGMSLLKYAENKEEE